MLKNKKGERGQSMAEFAMVMPVLVLLVTGLIMSGFYAFRSTEVDFRVFMAAEAESSYIDHFGAWREVITNRTWKDLWNYGGSRDAQRLRRSLGAYGGHTREYTISGFTFRESHQQTVEVRSWAFYAGPPDWTDEDAVKE